MKKIKLIVFASGGGTNAEKLFEQFKDHKQIEISTLICNKEGAGVIDRAAKFNIPVQLITNTEASNAKSLIEKCAAADYVILAGYLRKIPSEFIAHFNEKIVNLHPSLLPNYGGKGMYGSHVHKAVLANAEKETGITIHFVNENFDEGRIIAQFRTALSSKDDLASVQSKIQTLEHTYFPYVVEQIALGK